MIRERIDSDVAELVFRLLFSSIFIVLGGEHMFSDGLIQRLMPEWVPLPRLLSLAAGFLLLAGGASIAAGFRVHIAATALGIFIVIVTAVIHIPGMFLYPPELPSDWGWLWDLYQRSNFIKNVCLLGVCFHFLYHEPGRYSLDCYLDGEVGFEKHDRD
ncbi:MAG: DoxX family protein [Myxococcota bacterium]|jgi:uncharacterized membrane protein YphA (DoxX/SURF4 family)|nr:DoxX family protein [Myxococcota bacterium]